MKINSVLSNIDIFPGKEKISELKSLSRVIVNELKQELKKRKINAEVFLGGSFAKGTLLNAENYDIDVYVRFDIKNKDISNKLKPIAESVGKKLGKDVEQVHGSRDYYRIIINQSLYFEIIPVLKISHPKYAENVTDLSYFHVRYVKSKLKSMKQIKEVLLLKAFCKAAGVYGAESYIGGISGYGAECLIIYYKTLEKIARKLLEAKDKIIIDPEKKYKNSNEAILSLNESKTKSPIVLVDPTYKERNVLAALNNESFQILKDKLKRLLSKPSISLFEEEDNTEEKIKQYAKKERLNFVKIIFDTDKQAGDIAGTKLKKFSKFLESKIKSAFDISKSYFEYDDMHKGKLILACKSKMEIIQNGPPLSMKEHASKFKKMHSNAYVKDNKLYAKVKLEKNIDKFIEDYYIRDRKVIKSMDINNLTTEN